PQRHADRGAPDAHAQLPRVCAAPGRHDWRHPEKAGPTAAVATALALASGREDRMDEIDKLLQQIRANGDEVWIAGAAPDKAVARLERALGVQLPPSYRDFLTRFGAMTVAGSPISGIPDGEPLGEGTGWLYGDTLQFR